MPPGGKLSDSEIDTLKRWIDQGAEWPDDMTLFSVGEEGKGSSVARSLFAAIRAGKTGAVKRIVKQSDDLDDLTDQYGSSPLHYAAWLGNVSTLKFLLSQGADVNLANRMGVTPLMLAIGNLKKTEMLLERGADVNASSESDRTPLLLAAAKSNNGAVLRRLLSAGADVSAQDGRGWTALILAARTGDAKMLKLLMDAGAPVRNGEVAGLSPGTPLTHAAWAGDLESVKLLLARDGEEQQKSLDLSLIIAATHGYEEIVRALVEAGANPNANEYTGYVPDTPLHAAAYSDHRPLEIIPFFAVGHVIIQGVIIVMVDAVVAGCAGWCQYQAVLRGCFTEGVSGR